MKTSEWDFKVVILKVTTIIREKEFFFFETSLVVGNCLTIFKDIPT